MMADSMPPVAATRRVVVHHVGCSALCPVCYQPVEQTPLKLIGGHCDTNKGMCPCSYAPFDIAIKSDGAVVVAQRRERAELLAALRGLHRKTNEIITRLAELDRLEYGGVKNSCQLAKHRNEHL